MERYSFALILQIFPKSYLICGLPMFFPKALVDLSLVDRREKLTSSFNEVEGYFHIAQSLLTSSAEEMAAFLGQSLSQPCIEGIVVKKWVDDAAYCLAKRSFTWLKVQVLAQSNTKECVEQVTSNCVSVLCVLCVCVVEARLFGGHCGHY